MGMDETGTLKRLKALHKELIQPQIKDRTGRIVKLMGDGLLAEFPSVVDAVECAASIQRAMPKREDNCPEEQRIALRIGVHLGDIIIEGTDIFGDGVNVAARLEAVAQPGTVCISEDVHCQVKNKMTAHFQDLGEQELKNIEGRLRAFSVSLDPARISPKGFEVLTGERLDLPLQPSIAVLPFENMSHASRAGIFCRRHHRRHHYRFVAHARNVRHGPEFNLCLQRPGRGRPAGRA